MTGNKSKRHRYGRKKPKASPYDDKIQGATDFVYEEARGHGSLPGRKYGTRGGSRSKTR